MIFDYAGIQQLLPAAICIQVTSQHAGLPLCGAHLYTKREKEEVINSGNGHYRLLTWQPLPATLTIEHQQYEAATIIITETPAQQVIKLQLTP
jgi:hypothetical protein